MKKGKRFGSVLLALTLSMMLLCQVAQAADTGVKTFSDVPADHWASEAITAVASDHLMSYYADGKFKPDAEMSVADIIGTLMKAFDGDRPPMTVEEKKAFNWETPAWVPQGFANDYLYTKATRAQAAELIIRAMGQDPAGKDPLELVVNAKYFGAHGKADSHFTRAEMASVLYTMMYGIGGDNESLFLMDYELAGFSGQDAVEARAAMDRALDNVPVNLKAAFAEDGLMLYACTKPAYVEMWKVFTSRPVRESSGMFLKGKGILVNNLTGQTVTHEFGHYLAEKCGDDARIHQLYLQEGSAIMSATGRDYGSTTEQEFMAEAFRVYCTRSANSRLIPNTISYIEDLLNGI